MTSARTPPPKKAVMAVASIISGYVMIKPWIRVPKVPTMPVKIKAVLSPIVGTTILVAVRVPIMLQTAMTRSQFKCGRNTFCLISRTGTYIWA